MFAVNLVAFLNMSRMPEFLPLWLCLRDVVQGEVVQPERSRPGHDAVLVDVTAERWAAIVQVIRRRLNRNQCPLYERVDGKWRRV